MENRPRICATITEDNLEAVKRIEPEVDLFEVRIDLIGRGWQRLARHLGKPWIACNRRAKEGGSWKRSESERIDELLSATELGADIVDIELGTPGLEKVVRGIRGRAKRLLSYHDLKETPSLERMRVIVRNQLAAGADICKLVTTARRFEDNITTLQLISDMTENRVVAFAMGDLGYISRVLCPLAGSAFTYASIEEGKESAPGQITVRHLINIYRMLKVGR